MYHKMNIFNKTPKLYHYTSLFALARILKTGMLRFGALPRMNDITEAVKEIYIQHNDDSTNWNIIEQVEEELKRDGLISLTQDGARAGYAINSMWGHYAEKGEGCCIIFDKEAIINECNKLGLKYGEIAYDDAAPQIIINYKPDRIGILESKFEEIFLHKSEDWASEQEFRIVNFDTTKGIEGLPILDAILAVAFHTNCKSSVFDRPTIQDSISKLKDIPALEYHYSSLWGDNNSVMLLDSKGNNWVGMDLSKMKIDI